MQPAVPPGGIDLDGKERVAPLAGCASPRRRGGRTRKGIVRGRSPSAFRLGAGEACVEGNGRGGRYGGHWGWWADDEVEGSCWLTAGSETSRHLKGPSPGKAVILSGRGREMEVMPTTQNIYGCSPEDGSDLDLTRSYRCRRGFHLYVISLPLLGQH